MSGLATQAPIPPTKEMVAWNYLLTEPAGPQPVDPAVETKSLLWCRDHRMPHLGLRVRSEIAALERSLEEPNATMPHWANGVRHNVHRRHHLLNALAVLEGKAEAWIPPDPEVVRLEAARVVVRAAAGQFGLAKVLEIAHYRLADLDRARTGSGMALASVSQSGDYDAVVGGARMHHAALATVNRDYLELVEAGDRVPKALGARVAGVVAECGGSEAIVAALTEAALMDAGKVASDPETWKGRQLSPVVLAALDARRATDSDRRRLAEVSDMLEVLGLDDEADADGPVGTGLLTERASLRAAMRLARSDARSRVQGSAARVVRLACSGALDSLQTLARAVYDHPQSFPPDMGARLRAVGGEALADAGLLAFGSLKFPARTFELAGKDARSGEKFSYTLPAGSNTPVSI